MTRPTVVCIVAALGTLSLHCSTDDGDALHARVSAGTAGSQVQQDAAREIVDSAGAGGAAVASDAAGAAGNDTQPVDAASSADARESAPPIDAAPEVGATPCTALFCEGFENGLDAAAWTIDADNGSATVVTDRVAHGAKALRIRINAQGDHAAIVRAAPAGIGTHVFGRASFYLASATTVPPSPAHTVYFSAGDGLSQKHYEVGGYDKGWQLSYWYPGGENVAGGGMVPVNRWACVEWELDDAPMGTVRIFVDGAKNAEFTNAGGGNKFTAFSKLTFGMKYFQKVAADADLFLDDIAVDTKRVNCLP
jgi:hypothetical protein